jgi:hypothetical protein
MARRVHLAARDLFFRSKLAAVIAAAGAESTRDAAACDVAVIELGAPDAEAQIRMLAGRGIPVLAFGSHVGADELRAARETGATAVPNSQVVEKLRELLHTT